MTLKRCRIVGTRILSAGVPETLSLLQLVDKFAKSGSRAAKMNLLALRQGDYVGTTINNTITGHPSSFVLLSNNGNDISYLIKKNPGFETKIVEIYRVEDVTIQKSVVDSPTSGQG